MERPAHKNKKRLMTLPADEFLRRFLLHVLPRGFVRIRYYGFLSSRRRRELVPLCKLTVSPRYPVEMRVVRRGPTTIDLNGGSYLIARVDAMQTAARREPQLTYGKSRKWTVAWASLIQIAITLSQ
jgi:hypothetical protein